MTIIDLFQETYAAVTVNKVRSGLTVLGIVIGIGSVIGMVSIGQGAQAAVQSSIQSIGSNLLMIYPGAQRGAGMQVSTGRGSAQSLTNADAASVAALPGVKAVSPEVARRYQVTAKGTNTNTQVIGTSPDYLTVHNVEVADGAFFGNQQTQSAAKVAVIGPTTRDDLFGAEAAAVGQVIRINRIEFKVIGVTKSKGGSGFNNQDDVIYTPLTTAQRFLSGNDFVSTISLAALEESGMKELQQAATDLLLTRHHIDDPALADFNILNQADIVAAASSVTGTFTALLAAIAGISLIVGGIGIMNMMLTTVTERTREIGLRKAVGALRGNISQQFLAESVALTFLGGFFGILLGWFLSWIVTKFAGIATEVSFSSVLMAFGVAAVIGIIFGYYPARRASLLNPIEALRYE